jgi:hypothetical protein
LLTDFTDQPETYGNTNLETISTLKFRIQQNIEFINNNFNKCYYSSENLKKQNDFLIYYGDRFFYYPNIANISYYYKIKRNNRYSRIISFDYFFSRNEWRQPFLICNEIKLTIVKTKETLEEIKKRYYCIETELNDSIVIRENMLKEKEICYEELVTQKEVTRIFNLDAL